MIYELITEFTALLLIFSVACCIIYNYQHEEIEYELIV